MRKYSIYIILFLLLKHLNVFSESTTRLEIYRSEPKQKDTVRYFHIGVIPYQLFSRSTGIYLGYDLKNCSIEYRPMYTLPTQNLTLSYFTGLTHEWFFYRGINNNILLSLHSKGKRSVSIILGYKYWWYNSNSIPVDNISTASSYSFNKRQSAKKSGPTVGFEFSRKLSRKNFESAFFVDASLTYFSGTRIVFESYQPMGNYATSSYPETRSFSELAFNVSLGFKLGGRIKK